MFKELENSLKDALAYEHGETLDLRVTELPAKPPLPNPAQIREIRLSLNATQVIFAMYLNVHANTVRSWEQGTRKPRGGDLKLLSIAKWHPGALLTAGSMSRRAREEGKDETR